MGETIEKMYQEYLEKVSAKEEQMTEIQRIEMRRAFFAGVSSLLASMIDGEDINPEEMIDEAARFWKSEAERHYNDQKEQDEPSV